MVFARPTIIWRLWNPDQSQGPGKVLERCPDGSGLELIVSLCLGSLHGLIVGVVFVSRLIVVTASHGWSGDVLLLCLLDLKRRLECSTGLACSSDREVTKACTEGTQG